MKAFILLSNLFFTSCAISQINKIYDSKNSSYISKEEFLNNISNNRNIIIGENHNTQSIQNTEAELIKLIHNYTQKEIAFYWEFLNIDDTDLPQGLIDIKNGNLSIGMFLRQHTLSSNTEYTLLIETLIKTNSLIFPANISRTVKQNVLKNGINSVDQKLIPKDHYLSGPNYYSRFKSAMGHHTTPELLDKYYEVQCLVDSVMAKAYNPRPDKINILLSGSFHSDYFDGVYEKIKNHLPLPPLNIKITNDPNIINQENEYGVLSDFIILTQ